jgi:hypothetical protein
MKAEYGNIWKGVTEDTRLFGLWENAQDGVGTV